jgi:hypothetical protein
MVKAKPKSMLNRGSGRDAKMGYCRDFGKRQNELKLK